MAFPTNKIQVMGDGSVLRDPVHLPVPHGEFVRHDTGVPVPDDGYQYVMVQHEIVLFGTTRHAFNQSNQREPRPAVANEPWGLKTLANHNGDYHPISDPWQWWFYNFFDWSSGFRLPKGEKIGTHVNPMNPNIVYTDYTPGSKLFLYSEAIKDAKGNTDAVSPETGGRDVVTKRNMFSSRPWSWLCCCHTGALLRVLSRNGTVLKIQAIDLLKPPPSYTNVPIYLYYYATQVHVDGRVTRYPDVKEAFEVHGYPPAGTRLPLVAPGGYFFIDKSACVEMLPNQIWKPYLETV